MTAGLIKHTYSMTLRHVMIIGFVVMLNPIEDFGNAWWGNNHSMSFDSSNSLLSRSEQKIDARKSGNHG